MKPNKYEVDYKKHLANEKKLREIKEKLKTLPLRKLDEPITKGWHILYELRDDIKRREDAFNIQQVLDLMYIPNYTRNIKHVRAIRRGEKGYTHTDQRGQKHWVAYAPHSKWVNLDEYDNLSPQLKKYFFLDTIWEAYTKFGRKRYKPFLPEYWTVLKAKADIHTHYHERGGALEKERDFLEDKIRAYWITNGRGWGHSYPKSKMRAETRDQIRKFIKGEIDDITNFKTAKDYEW